MRLYNALVLTAPFITGSLLAAVAGCDGITRSGVKDLFDTAGVRTTYGSAIFRDHVPERSATAVTLLEDAGYVWSARRTCTSSPTGSRPRTSTGATSSTRSTRSGSPADRAAAPRPRSSPAWPTPRWEPTRGGSIRIPAACCGIVGFKPTHGRVPLDGVFPLAPSFDHAGPMARTVAECADAARVLDPALETRPSTSPTSRRRHLAGRGRPARPRPRRGGGRALRPRDAGRVPVPGRRDAGVHAGGGRRPPRPLRRARRPVRAQRPREGRALPRDHRRGVRGRARGARALRGALRRDRRRLRPARRADARRRSRRTSARSRSTCAGRSSGSRSRSTRSAGRCWRLPCGTAEDGLPASISLIAPDGRDGLVLHTGLALERALSPV